MQMTPDVANEQTATSDHSGQWLAGELPKSSMPGILRALQQEGVRIDIDLTGDHAVLGLNDDKLLLDTSEAGLIDEELKQADLADARQTAEALQQTNHAPERKRGFFSRKIVRAVAVVAFAGVALVGAFTGNNQTASTPETNANPAIDITLDTPGAKAAFVRLCEAAQMLRETHPNASQQEIEVMATQALQFTVALEASQAS